MGSSLVISNDDALFSIQSKKYEDPRIDLNNRID